MSTRKTIAREFTLYSMSFFFMQLVTVALAVFIRNVLGPEQMGVWVGLQVVLTYAKYSNLGLAPAASREIPFEKGRGNAGRVTRIRDSSYAFTLLSSGGLSLGMVAAAFALKDRFGHLFFVSLLALAPMSFFQRVSTFCIAMLRAEKRFNFINRFNVYSSLANAALTVVLILALGLYGYYASMILSFAFNLAFILAFSGISFRLAWDWKELKPLLTMGLGLIAVGLAGTFFVTADKMAIGAFAGAAALGVYSVTLMVGSLLASLPNNLGIIIFPYLNEAYGASKDPAEVRKFLVTPNLFFATYLSALVAFAWVASPPLVKMLLPGYAAGIGALKLSLFATLFMILSNAMGDALIAFKRHAWMIPLQLAIGGLAFAAHALALKAGWGVTAVSGICLAAFFALWAAYSSIALMRVGTAVEAWRHILEVSGAVGYFFAAALAADTLFPGEGARATLAKGIIVAVTSLPFLVAGERRFRTFRLVGQALCKRPNAAAAGAS